MALAILTALVVIVLRLVLHATGHAPEGTDFMLVHFLAIVTTVYFTDHRLLARDPGTPFPTLMREGFKSAAVYALIIAGFLWYYYAQIEEDYFFKRVEERIARGVLEGQDEALIRQRLTRFFTPFNYASITFFTLLATGVFNALLIGLLHHKLLRRVRR